MKKLMALLLAVALAAGSTTVAFAANRTYVDIDGPVSVDFEDTDGGNVLVPGVEYRFPLLDGNNYFDKDSADNYTIKASEYYGSGEKAKFSDLSVERGRDGIYYLVVKAKSNKDTYYDSQDAYVMFIVTDKYVDRDDKKVTSQREMDDYNDNANLGWSSWRDVKKEYDDPTDLVGECFIEGGDEIELKDYVTTEYVSFEQFEIAARDYDYINDDEYEVDNSMPLVMAGGDVSKSTLYFGDTAEYLAKFSSTKEKPFNLSYTTVTNPDVEDDNPRADIVCISFPGKPVFAANSYLIIKDRDMEYLYEWDDGDLIELDTTFEDGYLAYRTDHLTSYIASDRPLRDAIGSSDREESSSSSSSSSRPTTNTSSSNNAGNTGRPTKPNPDTGR